MSQMVQRRIRRRLMFLMTVPALLLSILVLLLSASARWQAEQVLEDQTIQLLVNQFAASADYALQSNQPALLKPSLARLLELPSVVRVQVHNVQGDVWFGQEKPQVVEVATTRIAAAIMSMPIQDDADDWLSNWSAEPRLLGAVSVDQQASRITPAQWLTLRQGLLMACLAGLLLLAISAVQARRLLRYIDRIRRGAELERQQRREALQDRQQQWHDDQLRQAAWGKWSHDVRTPLHGVAGMLELLETTHLDAEQRDYVTQARAAARAMEASLQQSPLPVTRIADFPDETALSKAESRWHQRRILLIEDDIISQRLLLGLLTEWGAQVTCVVNGADGLALPAQPWDLILVDGELPDMTAIDFARQWSAVHPALTIPMVVITAHSQPEKLAAYEAAGLGPVMQKPLRRRHLLAVLTPLFDNAI